MPFFSIPTCAATLRRPWVLAMAFLACSTAAPPAEFVGPVGSEEPNLFATRDGRVLLSWHEPTGEESYALRLAEREASGAWSAPMTVAEREFFVNWADFPSVVETADGHWVIHWLEKVARSPYAYHVMVSRSMDRGATWSAPEPPHGDRSPTEHGFVSMVPAPDGAVSLLWLDGRNTGGGHEGDEDRGAMSLRSTWILPDGRIEADVLVDDRVCDCCQTAMLLLDDGTLVAAYRDRSAEEIRDIAVSRRVHGEWTEPVHVGNDHWHMPACPVNGPSLATRGGDVAIAWYAAPDGNAHTSVAFSSDRGATFGAPIRIDEGNPMGRVDLEFLPNGSALAVWLEGVERDARIRAREVAPDGSLGDPWTVAPSSQSRRSGFPRVAVLERELVFAWTIPGEAGGIRTRTVPLD